MPLLALRVNDDLTLDAGWVEEVSDPQGFTRIITPPQKSMFFQLRDYLRQRSTTRSKLISIGLPEEALAATALCVMWGSYFAVLADFQKPFNRLTQKLLPKFVGRISNDEMARINIETSAALAHLIDLRLSDEKEYQQLIRNALACLPIPIRRVANPITHHTIYFYNIAYSLVDSPELEDLLSRTPPDKLAAAQANPTRVFTNTLINYGWRNAKFIEDIHSGRTSRAYPLRYRRITKDEYHALFRDTASRFWEGFMAMEAKLLPSQQGWAHNALAYLFYADAAISPTNWSLIEETRVVRLPGRESD